MARRDLRGGSFQQSQKKSSSGLAVFLLLLLLGSLGFSFYIYQENTKFKSDPNTGIVTESFIPHLELPPDVFLESLLGKSPHPDNIIL